MVNEHSRWLVVLLCTACLYAASVLIGALTDNRDAMTACQSRHSFAVCHHSLNR